MRGMRGGDARDEKGWPVVEVHGQQIQYEMYATPAELPAGQSYEYNQYDPPKSAVSGVSSQGQCHSMSSEPTVVTSPLSGRVSIER
jgi:hypothetical protein